MGYYLDTSILLDYSEKRGKNGELAFQLIQKLIKEQVTFVYSDLHLKELKGLNYTPFEIRSILTFGGIVQPKKIHISSVQLKQARKYAFLRKIPFGDALHAILARDNEMILVSTDPDFEKLHDLAVCKTPTALL